MSKDHSTEHFLCRIQKLKAIVFPLSKLSGLAQTELEKLTFGRSTRLFLFLWWLNPPKKSLEQFLA